MMSLSPQLARHALDAAPDAMIVLQAGIIRFGNRQACTLFGYSHDELIGMPVHLLVPERLREQHRSDHAAYEKAPSFRVMGKGQPLFGLRKDGTEFAVEISLSPVEDDGRVLTAAAIRDVTDRRQAEAELGHARAAADEARETAERANQSKSRFLATASHDLRQPLQTLALLNGALSRILQGSPASEAISQQEQAIASMSRLLDSLLDISKLESGAIKPEPGDFAINTLFEELRREFASLAANKGLRFEVTPSEDCAHSDPALVAQILRNLVSNAIKYTCAGRVALRCTHEQAESVRIEVLDTGIGIPPQQLPHIYDEFYQGGVPPNTAREGYGLGLSIVKRIVKLLGAELDVRSRVGKGSVFTLTLPSGRGAVRPAAAGAVHRAPATHPPARILLVEDDVAVANATRLLLRSDGYQTIAAITEEEALEQAARNPDIDLLIADYHLGEGKTGTQVISRLRSLLKRPIKAIILTGDTSSAIRNLPPDPGTRLASKPVNAEQFLRLLRELLAAD